MTKIQNQIILLCTIHSINHRNPFDFFSVLDSISRRFFAFILRGEKACNIGITYKSHSIFKSYAINHTIFFDGVPKRSLLQLKTLSQYTNFLIAYGFRQIDISFSYRALFENSKC